MHARVLINVNVHIKFEVLSFTHSKDTIGPQNSQTGLVTLTTPLSGWFNIRGLAVATVNLQTKFQACISTSYEDIKCSS